MMAEYVIAVTGVLESLGRKDAIEAIKKAGFEYTASVTGKTTHLVVGATPGLEKIAKAESGNIHFLLEEPFLRLVGAPHTGIIPGME
jgi:DNA ligase (NAD+)